MSVVPEGLYFCSQCLPLWVLFAQNPSSCPLGSDSDAKTTSKYPKSIEKIAHNHQTYTRCYSKKHTQIWRASPLLRVQKERINKIKGIPPSRVIKHSINQSIHQSIHQSPHQIGPDPSNKWRAFPPLSNSLQYTAMTTTDSIAIQKLTLLSAHAGI